MRLVVADAGPLHYLVLTGDIAEDVALLAPALRLAASLRPRLGAFAVLGTLNNAATSGSGT